MKERPIIISGEMVRAILDGRKTITRRVIKPQPNFEADGCDPALLENPNRWWDFWSRNSDLKRIKSPYVISDRLWVRENFALFGDKKQYVHYVASHGKLGSGNIPSIFMPHWASRITLEITNIEVKKLNEMSDEDAIKEGIKGWTNQASPIDCFICLWNKINGKKYPWESNPWVWIIEFIKVGVLPL
jgi:hypothetical protein